ncbi:hypothetical protein ACWDYJ_32445 [Streptomyces sp. NPDC003042]
MSEPPHPRRQGTSSIPRTSPDRAAACERTPRRLESSFQRLEEQVSLRTDNAAG